MKAEEVAPPAAIASKTNKLDADSEVAPPAATNPKTNKPEVLPDTKSEVAPPIQVQLFSKGKQVVVNHFSKKKDRKHIDAQEISRRN
uniref:Uncharacterized protein LOC104234111 n=1 Tax=Nicotiana sylvestris TaxID=4096 RepID=A0A1U7X4Y2_NICSY|nr:PREDICTED: uncharacterized protein LOC104234111 [Nicotiana sylvestris]